MELTPHKVMSYRPVHFVDYAERFAQTSAQWSDATVEQLGEATQLLDGPWTGVAATAYGLVAQADHTVVTAAAGQADAAAQMAATDGDLVWDAAASAQATLTAARSAGIDVSPYWQMVDKLPAAPTPGGKQWRQAEIQWHAQQISTAVQALVAQDQRAAAAMRVAGDFSQYHQPPDGHIQAVDYTVNQDGTVKYTPDQHPPALINDHGGQTPVPADPRSHVGTSREIIDGFGRILIGVGTEAGGVLAAPATGGLSMVGTVPGGALPIYDGLDDLSRLTNMGRIPGAPPIIGQDGPG